MIGTHSWGVFHNSNIFKLLYKANAAALSFATQHAISPEFGGEECLNTSFPLPTLL